jgi:hypothetical protein
MSKCDAEVPRGQLCPKCDQEHKQPLTRAGAAVAALLIAAALGGLCYLAWRSNRGGYGYGYGAEW